MNIKIIITVLFLIFTPAQPQFTWSDGAIDGTSVYLWIADNPALRDTRALRECKLAGVLEARKPTTNDDPETVQLLDKLRARSLAGFSSLTSSGMLYVVPFSTEAYSVCDTCEVKTRFLVSLTVNASTETVNVLVPMLKEGLIYLSRLQPDTWTPQDKKLFAEAESFGRTRGRGVWRYKESVWRENEAPRTVKPTAPSYPTRNH